LEGNLKNLTKVLVLAGFLAIAPASASFAACGFGTKLWDGNDGIAAKILAFTTNVWTFKGISTTSEISGCGEEDNLFKKIGQGEHLDAVAHLIQIRSEDREGFQALAQNNFELLFPHDNVTAGEMLEQLSQLMAENDALASYVES